MFPPLPMGREIAVAAAKVVAVSAAAAGRGAATAEIKNAIPNGRNGLFKSAAFLKPLKAVKK
jgi:hypothetical protein